MFPAQSFTYAALKLAAKGKPIPITDDTCNLLPGLLWSGHFENITHGTGPGYFHATLTEQGRAFLKWLET